MICQLGVLKMTKDGNAEKLRILFVYAYFVMLVRFSAYPPPAHCALSAAGEQLFSFYTDPAQPVAERRSRLEEQYLFSCRCPRCLAESPSP